jgi:hypothetical protein
MLGTDSAADEFDARPCVSSDGAGSSRRSRPYLRALVPVQADTTSLSECPETRVTRR